jgi:hypothetical protein
VPRLADAARRLPETFPVLVLSDLAKDGPDGLVEDVVVRGRSGEGLRLGYGHRRLSSGEGAAR